MGALIIVALWVIFGISTSYIARTKGKDGWFWFGIGFLLGPIGLLIVLLIK